MLISTQVNYLHSHGLAHTELRLENVHISPVDRHIKVSSRFFIDTDTSDMNYDMESDKNSYLLFMNLFYV